MILTVEIQMPTMKDLKNLSKNISLEIDLHTYFINASLHYIYTQYQDVKIGLD